MSVEGMKIGAKSFAVKIWYFVIGSLIAGLATECVNLRSENAETRRMMAETLSNVERTQNVSSNCLMTLSNLKGRVGLAIEEMKPSDSQKQLNLAHAPNVSVANLSSPTTR